MQSPKVVYTISAESRWGPRKETRLAATSAMCLADIWAESGCTNVLVTDTFGTAFEREAFRLTLPIVRRMAERHRR